ncbi:MAG: amine oxidase [Anaerolineaceae bacterium]|nr:amine oxidase [Anaerolineaceae bacterium]
MGTNNSSRVVVIGAGIGGLTTAALLAQAGYQVTVLEAGTYAGGSAGTFLHQGYRFDAGATVAGGFHTNGPHALIGQMLDLEWPVRQHDPAWVVHLPEQQIALTQNNEEVLAAFPDAPDFWQQQHRLAELGWKLAAAGMPWPPGDAAEFSQLIRVGLSHFPEDLRVIPYAFQTVADWAKRSGLHEHRNFRRFLDAQLLISAQTTSDRVNALWGATALDLARQGVYHVAGGMGGLADVLVDKIHSLGGQVIYRQRVTGIDVEAGQVTGVRVRKGRRSPVEQRLPADFVIANLTPWSLDQLLGDDSPTRLQREVAHLQPGWGAFVLHVGVRAGQLPKLTADHHQMIAHLDGPLGEGNSVFMSLSPAWDTSRAPDGHRAVTITTHTRTQPWWDAIAQDSSVYEARKAEYTALLLDNIERAIPGFARSIDLLLSGSPVTYQFYTGRYQGMVGGFPITSLFRVRGPRTGISNLRLVGDSIFPGQSTAGVTLGAIRVAAGVQRHLPLRTAQTYSFREATRS